MLLKARAVEFCRMGEDEFVCRFLGESKEDILMTMEPRFIKEDEAYILKFGSTLVIHSQTMPPFEDTDEFDRYFNEL